MTINDFLTLNNRVRSTAWANIVTASLLDKLEWAFLSQLPFLQGSRELYLYQIDDLLFFSPAFWFDVIYKFCCNVCEHFLIFSFWLHYWIAVDKLLDYPQDCLPRNCLLVGNAEVGNSECITHRMWSCINFCAVSAHNFLNDCRSCCIKSDNNNKVRCTEVGGTATEDRLVQEIFIHLVP